MFVLSYVLPPRRISEERLPENTAHAENEEN